jgi:hypothetical protein
MMAPEPSEPNRIRPFNRLRSSGSTDEIVPGTVIDHLLTETEQQHAMAESGEFEFLGKAMDQRQTRAALYPILYESASEQLTSGVSHEEIRAEMMSLAETEDTIYASVAREAYEDALAGRPPRP